MIGTKNVASSAHYYGHSSTYNEGIRDAYFPQNVKDICSDYIRPIEHIDDGIKSSYIGAKTGKTIQCAGERQAIPDCQYKDKDVSLFLDRSNFTSSPPLCSSIEEDLVFSFADIETSYQWQNKNGKITTTELRFASSSW